MLDVERSFERLLGRQPSDKEIQNLYRVKSALDLKDNDALWLILIALESYDTLYRRYPGMVNAEIQKTVDEQRAAIAVLADVETKKAIRTLAEAVNRASEAVALRLTQASWLQACGVMMLGMVVFGSFCMFIGYVLGSGNLPWWAPRASEHQSLAGLVLAALARTPAGWIGIVAAGSCSLASVWHGRKEIHDLRRRDLALWAILLLALAFGFLMPLL
ncbi:MAG: hypothetical protein V4724_07385 [Pseudomonadota bacterium]